MITKYGVFEIEMVGPSAGNPFVDVDLRAEFKHLNRTKIVSGFYDGNGIYKIRFMPDTEGEWHYVTCSNVAELNGKMDSFTCLPAVEGDHGPVRVTEGFHFAFDDRTPFYPVGTTAYAWTNQNSVIVEQTLETLKNTAFNKIRMCVFPKHYDYNHNEPPLYPYEGGMVENDEQEATVYKFDFMRPNPEFWKDFEHRILQLKEMGIEADLIIFHPYDRWGFSRMSRDENRLYLRYVVARLSAYANIWWSMANEYDLFHHRTTADWEEYAKTVQEWDAFEHLQSIHNCFGFYDFSKGWISHCSIQREKVYSHCDLVSEWRKQYGKPIMVDEICYEGNVSLGWGNITGEELVRRFWEVTVRGGYCTHGETYINEEEVLWWSKGGRLIGDSPERIAFLRKILEETPGYLDPKPEDPMDWDLPWALAGKRFSVSSQTPFGTFNTYAAEYMLCYFGFNRPLHRRFSLPEEISYEVEIIDTWNMTIEKLPGTYSGNIELQLPGKIYIALRFRALQ